jgi:hypothetical protein
MRVAEKLVSHAYPARFPPTNPRPGRGLQRQSVSRFSRSVSAAILGKRCVRRARLCASTKQRLMLDGGEPADYHRGILRCCVANTKPARRPRRDTSIENTVQRSKLLGTAKDSRHVSDAAAQVMTRGDVGPQRIVAAERPPPSSPTRRDRSSLSALCRTATKQSREAPNVATEPVQARLRCFLSSPAAYIVYSIYRLKHVMSPSPAAIIRCNEPQIDDSPTDFRFPTH